MILIGIDPDLHKNGVAEYNTITKKIKTYALEFWDLISYLNKMNIENGNTIKVRLGAGWENPKTNWHESKGKGVDQKISMSIGMNHGVGMKIMEWCEYHEVPYDLCVPKKGATKWSQEKVTKLTGIKRVNEDIRDAISFVWGF
jgi:hypothetical protein